MAHSIEYQDAIKLWIGNHPNPAERPTIVVTKEDYNLLPLKNAPNWNRTIEVQDLITCKHVKIRRAKCELLNCNCAIEFAE